MIVVVNFAPAREVKFKSIERARQFIGKVGIESFDIWIDGQLHQITVKNFKTSEVESEFFNTIDTE